MSQNGVVAHAQQSLPSFAQAFSPSSLDQISQGSRISLPPIQTQDRSRLTSPANASYSRQSSAEPSNPRKRGRESHENDSDSKYVYAVSIDDGTLTSWLARIHLQFLESKKSLSKTISILLLPIRRIVMACRIPLAPRHLPVYIL